MTQDEQLTQMKANQANYKKVFASEEGKKVLKDLEGKCFINSPTICKEPHEMAFREGQRAVVLHIKTLLTMDIDKIRKQIEEQELKNG